ncbi:response regulator transcription factor [Pseudohongiella sp. SYSU M77423]|uniref:response regulator transcription factor n=1 Tax=Pseudohongiella sp. SYSU M77423 TaxID=3042312 RepID=UPI000C49831D|nr:response regulator transcription factor [Pseudohongiella sp. SYSU M77423]MAY54366.1 two-component system response regulator [Gammaproteobacteria bacterium]MEC8859260.1 response regulator transcription factor [Pseudomonadota bacterium]HBN16326.1 two-component system response regulator [Pseudohongiella sp.]MBJ54674.1 two-component system response regulator [Gammaproteobacteria bacterium]MDH7943636.1 response regulator transcription factor [Pseudohongiella sp. SYSU M77423]|tara:strand:- start:561 stop:1097 length:537 start_codon:yes stop_codon:yes gene_type:complete
MSNNSLLLIEDDEVFASVLVRAFQRRGFETAHATDIPTARQLIASTTFTHAVVDLNLDGQSSLELIPLLRNCAPASRILMLTGYASIATAVEAIKLGADNYLAKPADTNEILAALQEDSIDSTLEPEFQEPMSVRRLEWEHIQKVLKENNGNISETARQLKMHRRTLQRKLQKKPVSG